MKEPHKISPRLLGYLCSWHNTTVEKQTAAGNFVDLSLDEFIGLFEKRQLRSLQRAIDEQRLAGQQNEKNQYAYVATWKSYAACSSGIYNRHTACICSRMKSAKINLPKKGDKLRPGHAANIGTALAGKAKSEDHRRNISDGKRGRPITGWSEKRKAERRALLAAKKANTGMTP